MTQNFIKIKQFSQWINRRQLQLLETAYQGAQEIAALEEKYFQGEKITYTPEQSKTISDYVTSLRDRQLFKIRVNLAQFQIGGFFLNYQQQPSEVTEIDSDEAIDQEAEVIQKLEYIESVIRKYRELDDELELTIAEIAPASESIKQDIQPTLESKEVAVKTVDPVITIANSDSSTKGPEFLKKRFLGLGKDLDPYYEKQMVQELRLYRKQNRIAIRWLIILLLVPILIQVLFKNLVFEPVLGNYSNKNPTQIELSQEIKENLLREFADFKERLEVEELLGTIPKMSFEQRQERLREDAVELWREAREEELNGLKNLLADGVALLTFVGIVYFNRSKLTVIRNFSNRTFLSLNDPVKVFLFILVTDMFVGFHSAEGWEVLLVGVTEHLGLSENQAAINTFIATVPVIMDSCIKFWIFSYLTRYSPSTSAIYERMNT